MLSRNAAAGLLIAVGLLAVAQTAAGACPSCAPADGEGGSGFLAATFLMMGLPLALLGSGVWWLVRTYRGETPDPHHQDPGSGHAPRGTGRPTETRRRRSEDHR